MRGFVGIDLAIESVPDATTLLRFRHLLEKHALTQRIFQEINTHLAEKGLFMREGTIVDATIVSAAPSTKNMTKQRDPDMKQTRKGNQWYLGMKARIGVDAVTGLTHTVVATSANVADVTMVEHLVRDDDNRVHADAGYIGMGKRLDEEKDAEDPRCCIAAGICQHSWHMKWCWLFKILLPAVSDPAPDSNALSPAGRVFGCHLSIAPGDAVSRPRRPLGAASECLWPRRHDAGSA